MSQVSVPIAVEKCGLPEDFEMIVAGGCSMPSTAIDACSSEPEMNRKGYCTGGPGSVAGKNASRRNAPMRKVASEKKPVT